MRNYKKESAWQKQKYNNIQVKIKKELGVKLRRKLKENNKSITEFITTCVKRYLKDS